MRRLLLTVLSTLPLACASSQETCTELGCENSARVNYGQLISGPYDLVILAEGETVMARCNDPDALETADNPDNLRCNANGFDVDGGLLAGASSMFITIIDVATGDALFQNNEVLLSVVGQNTPNGPDCDPICVDRAGSL